MGLLLLCPVIQSDLYCILKGRCLRVLLVVKPKGCYLPLTTRAREVIDVVCSANNSKA